MINNPIKCPDFSFTREMRCRLIANEIDDWLSKKELAELLYEFDFGFDPKSELLEKLERFRSKEFESLWDYRKNKERFEVDADKIEFPAKTRKKINDAAFALGLVGVEESCYKSPDYILPLGGAGISNLKRCELAADLFNKIERKPVVAALSAKRKISDGSTDRSDTDLFAPKAKTEFEAICAGMQIAFGSNSYEKEVSDPETEIIHFQTENKSDKLFALSAPPSNSNSRATTDDNFRFFFSYFDVKPGAKIICCTGQRYCIYQQIVALNYALEYRVDIDTIGFPSSSLARPANYLMEIRRTITAILDLFEKTQNRL